MENKPDIFRMKYEGSLSYSDDKVRYFVAAGNETGGGLVALFENEPDARACSEQIQRTDDSYSITLYEGSPFDDEPRAIEEIEGGRKKIENILNPKDLNGRPTLF